MTYEEVAELLDVPTRRVFTSLVEHHLQHLDEGCEFMFIKTMGGGFLRSTAGALSIDGFNDGRIRELLRLNLVSEIGYSKNATRFEVTAQSVKFYRYLQQQVGEVVDQVTQSSFHETSDGTRFARHHPEAARRLRTARDLLAIESDLKTTATDIGPHLRAALLDVASTKLIDFEGSPERSIDELVRRTCGRHEHADPATALLAQYAQEVLRQAQRLTHLKDEEHKERALTGWKELQRSVRLATVACAELAALELVGPKVD